MRNEIRGEIRGEIKSSEKCREETVSVIREKAGQYRRQPETVSEVARNSNQKQKLQAIR